MFLLIPLFSSCDIDAVVDTHHFSPANPREMTVYHMVEAQELTPAHAVNLLSAHDLPEAKRMPLLAIPTWLHFEGLSHFPRSSGLFPRSTDRISPNLITYRDLAGARSCKVGSIEFQINRLRTQVRYVDSRRLYGTSDKRASGFISIEQHYCRNSPAAFM
jgi:hypothetical protein